MPRTLTLFLTALLVAGAQAAQISTTLTLNATATISSDFQSATLKGTANFTGGIGNGTFSQAVSLASALGATGLVLPLDVTVSGGTLKLQVTFPATVLSSSGSVSGTAQINGGSGTYQGATSPSFAISGTSSGSLTAGLTFTNFTGSTTVTTTGSGGGTPPTGPTITAVQDAGSYTSNVAQGSVFVVKGSNLAPTGKLTQASFPLPTTLDGVKITFAPTSGGAGTDAYMVYNCNTDVYGCVGEKTQLAAILPSTVTPGTYNVTVTNGTASAAFQATVVQRKTELLTADASGSGLVAGQELPNYDLNRFTTGTLGSYTISPAKPGQSVVVYATGMGPVTGGDNVGSPGFDFTKNGVTVNAIVGGVTIPAIYAGRTPTAAGLDQINFTLPANVPTGCTVSLQISTNGQLSNTTFMAIAPDANSNACVQPGYTAQQLKDFDNGKVVYSGGFDISQFGITVSGQSINSGTVGGGFYAVTGYQLGSAPQGTVSSTQIGSCTVTQTTGTSGTSAGGKAKGLDAGAVTMSGPGISGNLTITQDPANKTYSLLLGSSFGGGTSVSIGAGKYTLNGAGGADVGSFSTSLTLGTPLTVTGGLPTSVTRSSGLTLNWTGGNDSDYVEIFGSASTGTGANATTTSFLCLTTAGPQKNFTVPSSVLSQLPAVTANASGSGGILAVLSGPTPTPFTAQAKADGSTINAAFSALIGTGALVSYQ